MGIFGNAGLNVNDIDEDPYKFGNDHWPMFVESVKEMKATEKDGELTGKFGIYVFFEIAHDKYKSVRKFGRWIQLPTPLEIQNETGIAFDPTSNLEDAKVVKFLIKFMVSMGFGIDEINADTINPETDWAGKFFAAKLRAREGESGFDELSWFNPKPLNTDEMKTDGADEFTPEGTSNPDPVAAAEAAMKEDLGIA